MRLSTLIPAAALIAAATGQALSAQGTIASRVAQARDGVVRMQFDSRAGACGDGRDVVGFRHAMFARNFESYGSWNNTRCVSGPVRVALTLSRGEVTLVKTQIGGAWPQTDARVTDLGSVSAREASAYFFSLVPQLETESGKDRLLLPAVLADDPAVIQPLLSLARNSARTDRTRRQAVQWLGLVGDASIIPALVGFAKDGASDDYSEKKGMASAAVAALSQLDDNAGVPALIDLSREPAAGTRHSVAFWLGQNADPRALRRLHQMIEDTKEQERVRAQAIFALSHGDQTSSAEFQYLRDVYPRLDSDKLKESVFQGMQDDDVNGGRWLMLRARDASESTKIRRSALFWAGQREGTPTADILNFYRDENSASLREHAIFVLSQRQENAATDALIRIAKEDGDSKMRGKALFWLAQKKDPRVTKLISDILVR
ncbi:MAG: HEAT repeat domain-containing protein [Gemmatimonadota bacterium]